MLLSAGGRLFKVCGVQVFCCECVVCVFGGCSVCCTVPASECKQRGFTERGALYHCTDCRSNQGTMAQGCCGFVGLWSHCAWLFHCRCTHGVDARVHCILLLHLLGTRSMHGTSSTGYGLVLVCMNERLLVWHYTKAPGMARPLQQDAALHGVPHMRPPLLCLHSCTRRSVRPAV